MAPSQSTLRNNNNSRYSTYAVNSLGAVPAINFWDSSGYEVELEAPAEHQKTGTTSNSKKGKYVSFDVPLSLKNQIDKITPTYEVEIKIFHGGTTEEWCHHYYTVDKLIQDMGFDKFFTLKANKGMETITDIRDQKVGTRKEGDADDHARMEALKENILLKKQ